MSARSDLRAIEVIAPNFNRRLSGVTSTLDRLLPVQAKELNIAAVGPGLSAPVPRLGWRDIPRLRHKPLERPFRIWHARRNIEMLAGVVLRDLFRCPLRLVFTSASQRHHTAWSRFLIARMDAVISTSSATASYLKRPSAVIGHGIDIGLFHPVQDRAAAREALGLPQLRLIGCFGRIRRQKGTDVFVEAMLRVLPSRPDAGAVVLGRATGPHQKVLDELKARVRTAGLEDRILFPPEVAPSEIAAWYRTLDLFIAPQRWEGFGVTPLEAMATGLPVIATTVGAFPDLLTEETGILIRPGNADAMAAAAAALLDDAPRARQMGEAGLARARHAFSMEREAGQIREVYERLWRASENSFR